MRCDSPQLTMRPSRSHSPAPLPLPPPPLSLPSAAPSLRHRGSCSSTTSASPSPSPAPSPDRAASTASCSSVVPFSWERHPGIPKSSLSGLVVSSGSGSSAPLPLPPPPFRRPSPRQRRRRRAEDGARASSADPFAAAFVECTRPEEEDDDEGTTQQHGKLYPAAVVRKASPSTVSGRPWWLVGGGVVGLLDLYGCKSAIAVADGALLARRPIPSRR